MEKRIAFLNELIAYMQTDSKALAKMNRPEILAKCEEYELILPEGFNDHNNPATFKATPLLRNTIANNIRQRTLAAKNEIAELNLSILEAEQK